jgi:hypothetical protein
VWLLPKHGLAHRLPTCPPEIAELPAPDIRGPVLEAMREQDGTQPRRDSWRSTEGAGAGDERSAQCRIEAWRGDGSFGVARNSTPVWTLTLVILACTGEQMTCTASKGHFDLYSRISFILPRCDPEDSFERFAEGGVGIVTDGLCHFEQFFVTLA